MEKVIKRIRFDPEFQPVILRPLIKRSILSSVEEAREIVDAARVEGVRLKRQAESLVAKAKEERIRERKKGFQEGREEALAGLTEKMLEMENEKEAFFRDAEPQIVKMVMEIAEKVIGREVKKGAIVDVVKKALTQATGRKLIVRVHPDEMKKLKEKEAELLAGLEKVTSVQMKEDESLSLGSCLVESEKGTVDARLETQLAAIKKALGL